MVVRDDIRKCVVFVGYKMANGEFRFAGTAFFAGRDLVKELNLSASYLITAKHVIDGIRKLGLDQIWLRINLKDGTAKWVETPIANWLSHPTEDNVDVAVLSFSAEGFDHLMIPMHLFLTSELINKNKIGVGEEVFITGLFRHHHGKARNIPIIRIGNIAAMDEEKVFTRTLGPISAFLIEARSIGGLSGSPTFLNLGNTRIIDGEWKYAKDTIFFFLGLIHGHYDVSENRIDNSNDENSVNQIHMGIAIVVPCYKILEVLNHPQFVANEAGTAKQLRSQHGI